MDEGSHEVLISVDIEASGQSPSVASIVSIGACLVDDPDEQIYLELKPLADRAWDEDAALVHKLDRDRLETTGLEPAVAMARFDEWIKGASQRGRPVFVGFNASFDWMFVADYFWRYLGRNPFGISALDLKSYYMAHVKTGRWENTRKAFVNRSIGVAVEHSHNALEDAVEQAALARVLLRNEPGRFDRN
jgi:DNA polymerase III epsilon subunit-like protein